MISLLFYKDAVSDVKNRNSNENKEKHWMTRWWWCFYMFIIIGCFSWKKSSSSSFQSIWWWNFIKSIHFQWYVVIDSCLIHLFIHFFSIQTYIHSCILSQINNKRICIILMSSSSSSSLWLILSNRMNEWTWQTVVKCLCQQQQQPKQRIVRMMTKKKINLPGMMQNIVRNLVYPVWTMVNPFKIQKLCGVVGQICVSTILPSHHITFYFCTNFIFFSVQVFFSSLLFKQ